MNKVKKIISIITLVMVGLATSILVGAGVAYALPPGAIITPGYNGGGGGGGGGGGCDATSNTYRVDCAGTSWVYYKVTNYNMARDITFTRHPGDSGRLIIPQACAEHENGGFWHYGVNAINANINDASVNPSGTYTGRGQYGHWTTRLFTNFNSLSSGRGTYNMINSSLLNQEVGSGLYKAFGGTLTTPQGNFDMSGTQEHVIRDFKTAWNTLNPNNPITSDADALSKMAGQSMFCWWPGMGNAYYSKSNVSVMGYSEAGPGMSDFATTGIVTTGSADAKISITPEEEVQIVFSHNPYSMENDGTPKTQLYRSYFKLDGDRTGEYASFDNTDWFEVTIPGGAGGTYDSSIHDKYVNGEVTDWTGDGTYYVGNPRIYTDGDTNYAARDVINIKFNDVDPIGRWRFCETYAVFNEGEGDTRESEAKTTVCAEVEVAEEERAGYYSVSNVSNSQVGGWSTTGITNVRGTRTYADLATVNVGDAALLTFSHNVYSDRPITGVYVPWVATRENLTSTANYTISPQVTQYTSTSLYGANEMPNPMEGYYTIDDQYRTNDGYGYYYIVREQFNVTFHVPGTYTFCETIAVDDVENGYITASCARIVVSATYIAPLTCGLWQGSAPGYNDSGVLHGNTISGQTSILSKIRNPRLTEGGGHYGGWLGDFGTTGSGPVYTTYAKPTDTINWANCYYPGVQHLAFLKVAYYNQHTDSGPSNFVNTVSFKDQPLSGGTWSNQYSVESSVTSLLSFNNGVFRDTQYGPIIGRPDKVEPSDDAWTNTSANGSNPFKLDVGITVGKARPRESSNTYKVLKIDDAGKTFTEVMRTDGMPYKASIAYATHTWGCNLPWCCPCYRHLNSDFLRGNYGGWSATTGQLTTTTRVVVPYNFINTANFALNGSSDQNDVVYAGDNITVRDAEVVVNNRNNNVVESSYTTQVDQAEARLIAYISDKPASAQTQEQTPVDTHAASTNICNTGWLDKKQCMEVNKYNGGTTKLNPNGSIDGYTHSDAELGFDGSYNVYDASAGDYMCFVIAVFPWRSAPDTNTFTNDTTVKPQGEESKWLITAPQCKQVAKKPSVQVLGSSVYTNGGITTSVARKHNLFAATTYTPGLTTLAGIGGLGNPAIYFGSFSEEGVVANGLVTKFASGAAIGRNTTNAAKYGATNNDFCNKWTPLTFANYSKSNLYMLCGQNYEAAGKAGITDASIVDREALVDYFIPSNSETHPAGSYTLSGAVGKDLPNGAGKDIRYINADGEVTINSSNLSAYQTRVVRASGNVNINGDIIYNGTYYSMAEVPKAVIYASGDIHISCSVSRIDAILIAGGTVYSCNDYTVADTGTMENATRSLNQLVINGAVLASKVELARTYGNAAGEKSGLAAEVVNYDTSVLVWGRSAAGSGDSNAMSTVYMHELAPRY